MFTITNMSSDATPSKEGMIFPTQKQFLESCKSQQFSFLKPIMDYIFKAPKSQKLYQKLIQCCKIIFLKNPILILFELEFRIAENGEERWHYCFKNKCGFFCDSKEIDMKNNISKLWITGNLTIIDHAARGYGIKNFFSKLHQCDATYISLMGIKIEYADLKLLSKCVKDFHMNCSSVIYENDEMCPLEEIMEIFSNAESFNSCNNTNDKVKDYKKLVEICGTIKFVKFYDLDDAFDIEMFVEMLRDANCSSSVTYKRKIDANICFWKLNGENFDKSDIDDSVTEDSEMGEDSYGDDSEISKETSSSDSEMSTDSDEDN